MSSHSHALPTIHFFLEGTLCISSTSASSPSVAFIANITLQHGVAPCFGPAATQQLVPLRCAP
eukprot:954095-Pelagomonas_calceolata.AAC.2